MSKETISNDLNEKKKKLQKLNRESEISFFKTSMLEAFIIFARSPSLRWIAVTTKEDLCSK